MPVLSARVLIEGEAKGQLLRLESDISLWGGVDPCTGKVIDSRHPQFGECVGGKILAMNRSIGSSSGSSILLELLRLGCGPSGIILTEADFIVTLGAVVAREMDFGQIPVFQVSAKDLIELDGFLTMIPGGEIQYQQPGNSSSSPS
ncbi:aconitase X swivel domain-containing protein [Pseudomonadota bacterium]